MKMTGRGGSEPNAYRVCAHGEMLTNSGVVQRVPRLCPSVS
jgi:hypothetical protein